MSINRPALNRSEISSGDEAEAWIASSLRSANAYDAYGDKTSFRVRVLTRPINISAKDYAALTGQPGSSQDVGRRYMFKGRIEPEDGMPSPHRTLPDPCTLDSATDTECAARIISWHTTFFSAEGSQNLRPDIGDLVRVTLTPGDVGKYNLQYASFNDIQALRPPGSDGQTNRAAACNVTLKSIFEKEGRRRAGDGRQRIGVTGPTTGGTTGGALGAGVEDRPRPDNVVDAPRNPRVKFTYAEILSISQVIKPLLEFIAKHESPGQGYSAVNRGRPGDTPNIADVLPGVSSLTNLTIRQVMDYQKGGAKQNDVSGEKIAGTKFAPTGPGFLAVGKYQWIPSTLKLIVPQVQGIDTSSKFNAEVQEVLGTALILYKQRDMGKYILGMHPADEPGGDPGLQIAVQGMAREWASQPLAFNENNNKRGQSRYAGDGAGNASSVPIEDSEKQVYAAFLAVKQDNGLQALLRRKGYIT